MINSKISNSLHVPKLIFHVADLENVTLKKDVNAKKTRVGKNLQEIAVKQEHPNAYLKNKL